MQCQLEHANMTVRDMDETVTFLTTALPDFRVRGQGGGNGEGVRWLHVGTDDTYIALSEAVRELAEPRLRCEHPGVNHQGFVVDDVEGVKTRLLAAGYERWAEDNVHPYRKRLYFYDTEDNEWEFVQYLSDRPAERNDYSL